MHKNPPHAPATSNPYLPGPTAWSGSSKQASHPAINTAVGGVPVASLAPPSGQPTQVYASPAPVLGAIKPTPGHSATGPVRTVSEMFQGQVQGQGQAQRTTRTTSALSMRPSTAPIPTHNLPSSKHVPPGVAGRSSNPAPPVSAPTSRPASQASARTMTAPALSFTPPASAQSVYSHVQTLPPVRPSSQPTPKTHPLVRAATTIPVSAPFPAPRSASSQAPASVRPAARPT